MKRSDIESVKADAHRLLKRISEMERCAGWLDIPAGVVAQIMGYKPSATAEKHYTTRPLDLLRVHHKTIEAWMLEQAGVEFIPLEQRKLAVAK